MLGTWIPIAPPPGDGGDGGGGGGGGTGSTSYPASGMGSFTSVYSLQFGMASVPGGIEYPPEGGPGGGPQPVIDTFLPGSWLSGGGSGTGASVGGTNSGASESYNTDLAAIYASLEGFSTVPAHTSNGPFLATWNHDQGDEVPFMIITMPMDLRMPTIRKFFRRLEFFGKGNVHALVYCDNKFMCSGHAAMTANPGGHRYINLPRGAKGYTINIAMSVTGKLDGVSIHYDATGTDEKGE